MKERIWMVVLLLIIASISSGALGIMNVKTRPIIEKNKVLRLKESVLNAFHISYQKKNLEEIFEKKVKVKLIDNTPIYIYPAEGKVEALAFKIEGSGFWAPISATIALKPDLETIYGLSILDQEETPGLGSRITEPEFLRKFVGKKIKPEIVLVVRGKADKPNEIDAITGATMSSKALQDIINENVKNYREKIIKSNILGEISNES